MEKVETQTTEEQTRVQYLTKTAKEAVTIIKRQIEEPSITTTETPVKGAIRKYH